MKDSAQFYFIYCIGYFKYTMVFIVLSTHHNDYQTASSSYIFLRVLSVT